MCIRDRHKRTAIKATGEEVKAVEKKYKYKCDFCTRRFKTQSNMMKHRAQCIYNYDTTEEIYEIEKIVNVFGFADSRWFLVKWVGYDVPDWQPEHLLLRDGCRDSIREFWSSTHRNPSKEYYADPDGKHRCTICCKTYKRDQDLKAHRTRTGHFEDKKDNKVTKTATTDAVMQKRKVMQSKLSKVCWGEREVDNV